MTLSGHHNQMACRIVFKMLLLFDEFTGAGSFQQLKLLMSLNAQFKILLKSDNVYSF